MAILSSRALGVALVLLGTGACSAAREAPPEHTATGAQAIQLANFTGSSLPAKTIALTFDDGPGSRTLELSAFLKDQGIQATFFVNGHCFDADHPCGNTQSAAAIFTQVEADGHLIGNHTQDHLDLTTAFPAGADGDAALLAQLTETDAIIAPYVAQSHWLFRAPFGFWNSRDYTVVHASAMDKYVGPINWNAGGAMSGDDVTGYAADWDCWQNQDGFGLKTSTQCGNRYLNEIHDVGRGIVLMHDGDKGTTINNHDIANGGGNTVDMVKLVVVPALKAQGYTFARADAIPAITTALGVPPCDASCASCSGGAANQCTGCRPGSFLAGGTCTVCSSCAIGNYEVSACTASADIACAACPENTYRAAGACHACTECAAGSATTTACASSSDSTCTACAPGTFAAAAGATSCATCGSCDDADDCTADACDAVLGCTHTAIAGCTHSAPPPDAGRAAPPPVVDASSPGAEADAAAPTHDAPPSPPASDEGCATSTAPRPASGSAVLAFALTAWLLRRGSRTLAA